MWGSDKFSPPRGERHVIMATQGLCRAPPVSAMWQGVHHLGVLFHSYRGQVELVPWDLPEAQVLQPSVGLQAAA